MSDKTSCSERFCQNHPLLVAHLSAVQRHNRTKNLTSIKELSAGKVLHIEDSLAVLPEVQSAPEGQMADLGSGAGYPGIPLAIVSGRRTTLIEANKKKAQFLSEFLEEAKLTGLISVAACRSEELARDEANAFAVITARAVAALPVLLELAAPLLMEGGRFIAMKGKPEKTELERGEALADKLNMYQVSARSYLLTADNKELQHCVLVYEKKGQPSLGLPRRPGMAAKRPLA